MGKVHVVVAHPRPVMFLLGKHLVGSPKLQGGKFIGKVPAGPLRLGPKHLRLVLKCLYLAILGVIHLMQILHSLPVRLDVQIAQLKFLFRVIKPLSQFHPCPFNLF